MFELVDMGHNCSKSNAALGDLIHIHPSETTEFCSGTFFQDKGIYTCLAPGKYFLQGFGDFTARATVEVKGTGVYCDCRCENTYVLDVV